MEFYEKQMILLNTLLSSTEPIAGSILSKKCRISLKTIKKEVDDLNPFLKEVGCQVLSHSGVGYSIHIEDHEKLEKFKDTTMSQYDRNLYFKDNQMVRVHYIIRQLLTSRQNCYLPDLAQDCFCSVSVMNQDSKTVKAILASYHLSLKNKTNHGLVIEGSEWDKRLLLLSEHRIYRNYISNTHFSEEIAFKETFLEKQGKYQLVRSILVEELLANEFFIPYYIIPRITYLIILSTTRKSFYQELPSEQLQHMKQSTVYRLLMRIEAKLRPYGVELQEGDELTIATYMRAFRVVKYSKFLTLKSAPDIEALVEQFLSYFDDIIPIRSYDLVSFQRDLCCNFVPMVTRNELDIHIGTFVEETFVANAKQAGLLSTDCCIMLYQFFQKQKGYAFDMSDMLYLSYVFSNLLINVEKQMKKKVLVISRYGYYYAKNLVKKLEDLENANQIDFYPMEYLEIQKLDLKQYDFIATDIHEVYNNYSLFKVVPIYHYRTRKELSMFIHQVTKPSYLMEHSAFSKEDVIHLDPSQKDLYTLLEELFLHDYKTDKTTMKRYLEALKEKEVLSKSLQHNQIMVCRTLKDHLHQTFLKIVLFDSPMIHHQEEYHILILYNVKDNQISMLNYYDRLITNLLACDDLHLSQDQDVNYKQLVRIMSPS